MPDAAQLSTLALDVWRYGLRGEAPFVPHLLYPLVLDDERLEERAAGMRAATSWLLSADALVAYVDRGISRGMQAEIDSARAHGVDVEMRRIL